MQRDTVRTKTPSELCAMCFNLLSLKEQTLHVSGSWDTQTTSSKTALAGKAENPIKKGPLIRRSQFAQSGSEFHTSLLLLPTANHSKSTAARTNVRLVRRKEWCCHVPNDQHKGLRCGSPHGSVICWTVACVLTFAGGVLFLIKTEIKNTLLIEAMLYWGC